MKINFLKESYFRDVTVRQEDTRTNVEKAVQMSRKFVQEKMYDLVIDFFSNMPLEWTMGTNLSFYMIPVTVQNIMKVPRDYIKNYDYKKDFIEKIDFDNKVIYIKMYLVGSNYWAGQIHGPNFVFSSQDRGPINAMRDFEEAVKRKFPDFDVAYTVHVKEKIYLEKDLRPAVRLTFGIIDYDDLKYFFEKVKNLQITELFASIHDENFTRFIKDFRDDDRLNHKLSKITLVWNGDVDEKSIGLTFAIITNPYTADKATQVIKETVYSWQRKLKDLYEMEDSDEDMQSYDIDELNYIEKNLPLMKRLEKVDFKKLLK